MKPETIKKILKNAVKEAFIELLEESEGERPPTLLEVNREKWLAEQEEKWLAQKEKLIHDKFEDIRRLVDHQLYAKRVPIFYQYLKEKKFTHPDDGIDFLLGRGRWEDIEPADQEKEVTTQGKKSKKKKKNKKQKEEETVEAIKKLKADLNLDGKKIRTYDILIYPAQED